MNDIELIKRKIYELRGQRVMLDFDLAELYNVETRVLNQAVKRNIERFPADFMFRLTAEEWSLISSQFVMTSRAKRPKSALPMAFTEHGALMLSSVLRSDVAVGISIKVTRAFVAVRRALPIIATQRDIEDLRQRVKALEESGTATQAAVEETRKELMQIYEALTQLGEQKQEPLPEIGYEAIRKRSEKEAKQ
ncbi:MAG: ORF6N domain-containing protein [Bacteroidaceae bacterium]|nr:ORF6N domain-containing protein [Bacteroidaceae bacterium]MBR5053155.1 ORF6N domain-containing protein [Bacteroidaceae bacterium]